MAPQHARTAGLQALRRDGRQKGFDAEPKKDTDPAKCGWKLVATVDTRPAKGETGGQYGVSISDSAGPIGKYRYLLFDISETEKDDAFGNTFFSRINVIEADAKKESEADAEAPGRPAGVPIARFGQVSDHHRLCRRAGARRLGEEQAPADVRRVVSEAHREPCRARTTRRPAGLHRNHQ